MSADVATCASRTAANAIVKTRRAKTMSKTDDLESLAKECQKAYEKGFSDCKIGYSCLLHEQSLKNMSIVCRQEIPVFYGQMSQDRKEYLLSAGGNQETLCLDRRIRIPCEAIPEELRLYFFDRLDFNHVNFRAEVVVYVRETEAPCTT